MTDTHQSDNDINQVFHGSYVLRLWSAKSGDHHGYLLDARSGIRHPLHELAELPALVQSIISKTSDMKEKNE